MHLLILGSGEWALETVTPLGHPVARAASPREALDLIDRIEEVAGADGVGLVVVEGIEPAMALLGAWVDRTANEDSRVPVMVLCEEGDDERAAYEAGADQVLAPSASTALRRARIEALLRLRAAQVAASCREAELARRGQRLDELLRCLAHDLKNPIGVVHANVEYAMTRLPECDDDLTDALRDAELAARSTLGLIEDLSVLARDEDNQLAINSRTLDLRTLVADVRLACERSASDRRVALDLSCVGGVQLNGDGRMLGRAVENLVERAVRLAGGGGRVLLTAGADGDRVSFVISRTGRVPDVIERALLFDRFARLGGTKFGPGLGLYYSRRVAESHGGRVRLVEGRDFAESLVIELPGAVVRAARDLPSFSAAL